jgi:hypothetical protein
MTRLMRFWWRFAFAALAGSGLWLASEQGLVKQESAFVSTAEAVIGRPLTPLSYAGVARRTTRRAVAAGAAAGAAYRYAPAPGCVQTVDAYGRIIYRCP